MAVISAAAAPNSPPTPTAATLPCDFSESQSEQQSLVSLSPVGDFEVLL